MGKPSHEPEVIDCGQLFKRYARFVATFLYRHGVRGADLDDLVQEVFLTAHRRGGYRAGAASPTTFLANLALELNLARRRRGGRWQREQSDDAATAVGPQAPADPARVLSEQRAAQRFQRVLDNMEEGQRSVFILFELEGESCEAIASGLGLPLGTVHSRLHAARATFKKCVARLGEGSVRGDEERVQPMADGHVPRNDAGGAR